MRRWLLGTVCVSLVSLTGCGGDTRASLISNTNTQLGAAATSLSTIKNKLEDFVKKKEADTKDEEGAKKDLDDAVAAAKSLRETAKELQKISATVLVVTPPTDAEKKTYLDNSLKQIRTTREEVIQNQNQLKVVLAAVNEKYEDALKPLMQAYNEAEGDFAAIVRKR